MQAAKKFKIEIILIPKSLAGADAEAPAVYLQDEVLAIHGGARDGKITSKELFSELKRANVQMF
ncbi:MAG: hypothetical protein HZC11_00635 [Nitrospirae bacterium]|nr:hypothetical protein [Nitrospirota bacterium]